MMGFDLTERIIGSKNVAGLIPQELINVTF